MKLTSLITAFICSSTLSLAAQAALVDHGTYVTDTVAGLDWLKLTETVDRSYEDVSSKFGAGQEFDGWAYATRVQFANLLWGSGIYHAGFGFPPLHEVPLGSSYLKSSNQFTPWEFVELFGNIDPYEEPWDGIRSTGLLAEVSGTDFGSAHLFSYYNNSYEDNKLGYGVGAPILNSTSGSYQSWTSAYGSYLIRTSEVPVPGAVMLFGSALLGLAGMRKRSRNR
jgi:hypothetical protein